MQNLEEFLRAHVTNDLAKVIAALAKASLDVKKQIPFAMDLEQGVNPSGERQTKIDVYANDVFATSLLATSAVAEVASEEMQQPRNGEGSLHVAMDPLDGSSNISTNNTLGSIFGFYNKQLPCSGGNMVGSAFVTYGPMLTVTFSTGRGVHRFVAIEGNAFAMLDQGVSLPRSGDVFGVGGLRRDWIEPVEKFVSSLERRGMRLRYGGTFVGDYNQVLKYGGIFAYPSLKNKPRGKLRLLYEAAPMAFITKQAGGLASDGTDDILSLEPTELTQTCPVYLGSETLVRELEAMLSG